MNSLPLTTQLVRRSERLRPILDRMRRNLARYGPLCLRDLVILSDADYRTVLFLLMALEREGEIKAYDGLIVADGYPAVKAETQPNCGACEEHRRIGAGSGNRLKLPAEVANMRLAPSLFFGQRGVTPHTVLRRCEYMLGRGDVEDRRIVFLGDNDYQSIALASVANPARVVVLDIDVRVLSNIEHAAKTNGLAVETYHHDLFEALQPDLIGEFDVFVFDPYPTPDASFEAMAVANGIELLQTGGTGVGYTFALPTHKFNENSLSLQRMLTDFGLVITDVVPRLAEFVPITGEMIEDEERWIARLGDIDALVSHTKSLVRVETTGLTPAAAPIAERPHYGSAVERRTRLVEAMSSHYLLHSVGIDAQQQLVLDTASDGAHWQEAFAASQRANRCDTMPVGRLLREVVGRPVPDLEVGELLEESAGVTLRRLAADNGYSLTETDARVLATMAAGGYQGLADAGLAVDAQARALYLAARVFTSHFRVE